MHNTILKGVIFDMDGTLVDNIAFHKKSWLQFLAKHEIFLSESEFIAQNHGNIDEMIVRFFGNDLSYVEMKALGDEKEQLYRDLYRPFIKEIPGLKDFLDLLKSQGKLLGLATMGDRTNVDYTLAALNLTGYFDVVVSGLEVQHGKPNPEVFELACERLELYPEECIVFEDSEGGIQAAHAAGLEVIAVETSINNEKIMTLGCLFGIQDYNDPILINYFEEMKN